MAQGLCFLAPNIWMKFDWVTANVGDKYRWGGGLKYAVFDQHLAVSQKRC